MKKWYRWKWMIISLTFNIIILKSLKSFNSLKCLSHSHTSCPIAMTLVSFLTTRLYLPHELTLWRNLKKKHYSEIIKRKTNFTHVVLKNDLRGISWNDRRCENERDIWNMPASLEWTWKISLLAMSSFMPKNI